MKIIPLQAIPNQTLTIQLDENNWSINLHTCDNTPQTPGTAIITIDFNLNNVDILNGLRIVPNTFLIPYNYLATAGNFTMLTDNDDYPDYNLFGINQYLIYTSQAEIQAAINGTTA